ncbi:MAG: hypothetical protein ACR5LD_02445 [Symbiopectobacterium sp.]
MRFAGWDRRNFYYFQTLCSLAEHYRFDVEASYDSMSEKISHVILCGSGKDGIKFKYINDRGDTSVRCHPFEGMLNNMEQRYKETESSAVREELASLLVTVLVLVAAARVCVRKRAMYLSNRPRRRRFQT